MVRSPKQWNYLGNNPLVCETGDKKALTHTYCKENVSAKNCSFGDPLSHLCVSLVRAAHKKIFQVKKPYVSLRSCSAEIALN